MILDVDILYAGSFSQHLGYIRSVKTNAQQLLR